MKNDQIGLCWMAIIIMPTQPLPVRTSILPWALPPATIISERTLHDLGYTLDVLGFNMPL